MSLDRLSLERRRGVAQERNCRSGRKTGVLA